jgi:hypothetical protein
MVDGDYPNAAAAFALFVQDGWRWPLGANPHFGGVNIFFSDAAPWFALLGKLAVTLGLPAPSFHLLVLLNFVFHALAAYHLMHRLSDDRVTQGFGTLLLVFCLIMPVRTIGAQHIALSSYWLLLWAMAAVPMRPQDDGPWRRWAFLLPLAFATWSHAYLAAMSATVILACLLSQRRWLALPLVVAVPLTLLWAIGALEDVDVRLQGAKYFSLDLAAFVQSMGWALVPQLYLPATPQQGDSFVYLGTGALLALVAAVVLRLGPIRRPAAGPANPRLAVLALAGLALALFGMAFTLRIWGLTLLDLPIPSPLLPLYESFWAVGRFGAPLAIAMILAAALALGAMRRSAPGLIGAIMLAAVALQAGDLVHAGRIAITADQRQDVVDQRAALTSLLHNATWSGRVFRYVDHWGQLSPQRLLDYLLVGAGATEIRLTHSARPARDVLLRNGLAEARPGDLLVYPGARPDLACVRRGQFRDFELCLL